MERLSDISRHYEKKIEGLEIPSLSFDGSRVLYLVKPGLGNNAADVHFLQERVERVKEMEPSVIILSGLIEGENKYRNKERRQGLVMNLQEQVEASSLIIGKLLESNIPIVYVLSSNDREVAHDVTVDVVKALRKEDKEDFATYYDLDKFKQSKAWDDYYKYVLNVVVPRMMTLGVVYQPEEILEMYGQVSEINSPELQFTDGVDIIFKDSVHSVRESLKFGDKPLYQNPSDSAISATRQIRASGGEAPSLFVTLDQQQLFGIGGSDETWVQSVGGMLDPQRIIDYKTTPARAGQPAAWRAISTRRLLNAPSAVMNEIDENGIHRATIFDRYLMEKSDASERSSLDCFTDWQGGSVTARPDLQIKAVDLTLRQMGIMPVYIGTDGDLIHGRNYRGSDMENVSTGLIRIEDQLQELEERMERATAHASADLLASVRKVMIVPGNHEWNSSYRDTGAIFNLAISNIFKNIFRAKGLPADHVKAYEAMTTPLGEYARVWSAVEKDIAGYGLLMQHMITDKMAKAGGSNPPVFQAAKLFEGLGELVKDIDLGVFGHWHHPQYALFMHKLSVVCHSLAGLSGYEWMRAYRPVMGLTRIYLGGGQPPMIEFIPQSYLEKHKITEGYYKGKDLKKETKAHVQEIITSSQSNL